MIKQTFELISNIRKGNPYWSAKKGNIDYEVYFYRNKYYMIVIPHRMNISENVYQVDICCTIEEMEKYLKLEQSEGFENTFYERYQKGMTVAQIFKIASNRTSILKSLPNGWLTDEGKIALRFEEEIEDACAFSITLEDLEDNIREDVSKWKDKDDITVGVIDKLNIFVNYMC